MIRTLPRRWRPCYHRTMRARRLRNIDRNNTISGRRLRPLDLEINDEKRGKRGKNSKIWRKLICFLEKIVGFWRKIFKKWKNTGLLESDVESKKKVKSALRPRQNLISTYAEKSVHPAFPSSHHFGTYVYFSEIFRNFKNSGGDVCFGVFPDSDWHAAGDSCTVASHTYITLDRSKIGGAHLTKAKFRQTLGEQSRKTGHEAYRTVCSVSAPVSKPPQCWEWVIMPTLTKS